MYPRKMIVPQNQRMLYRSNNFIPQTINPTLLSSDDERFLWAPFVFGGLAGTALGYGIANNNQLNNGSYRPMYGPVPFYPIYPSPTYTSTNYYY